MQPSTQYLRRLVARQSTRLFPRAFSTRSHYPVAALSRHLRHATASQLVRPAPFSQLLARHNSQITASASTDSNRPVADQSPQPEQPSYQLTFTCKPCKHRSAHRVSKQGYHRGTVLIQCPSCKNRHVVSDHLKIFMDEASTLEDILQRHGSMIKKGKLGIRQGKVVGNEGEEDIEFWDDGSETIHKGAEK